MLRDGAALALPRSRKTRALLAYLALVDRRHRRDELCELLWDKPDDPRAALRWSLSKLRPLLAAGDGNALQADRDSVHIDRERAAVDVAEVRARLGSGPERIDHAGLLELEMQFRAPCLGDLEDVGTQRFRLWLESERRSIDELHRNVIAELVSRDALSPTERLRFAARGAALDPLRDEPNIEYLRLTLALAGATEAKEAFRTIREHYRAEGQDGSGLLAAWRRLSAPRDKSRIELPPGADAGREERTEPGEVPALPDKPSLAVLDFADIGSHPAGALLARGLTVDLNSRLAQLPSLFVIARQSSATLDANRLAPREIGRRLGVRYLVAGTTQRLERRVRTTVTLTDTTDESELWSDRFDRPLDDVFEVQDDITNAVIAAIEPAIERAEMERSLLKPPDSLSAWELFHRGLWHCFRFTSGDNELAHELFTKAVSMDPRFARAHAGISFTHYSRAFLHAVPDVEREIRKARDAGHRSVDLDGRDAMGHWSLGRALFLSRQHDDALLAIDQSLAVNPNFAQGHYTKGFIGTHAGLDDAILPSLDTAERLSPFDPLLFAMKSTRAISLALSGRVDEAAAWSIRGTQEPNAHFHIYAVAAACLEMAGRPADAADNARWVLERRPGYSVETFRRSFPHKDESRREPLLEALARAGIPRRA